MPTIAQIIAAKTAAAQQPAASVAPAAKAETLAERVELKEAIDRIDPRGKRARSGGLVLKKEDPQPTPPPAPEKDSDPRRSLTVPVGHDLPMVPANADRETATWHQAMQAFETELCLIRHPDEPEQAWLAIKPERPELKPILIHRLPWRMWDPPWAPTENEPF